MAWDVEYRLLENIFVEMKSLLNSVSVIIVAGMIVSGCATKDEKARNNIQGSWQIEFVSENGQDVTAEYTSTLVNYRITFDNNGGFVERYQQTAGGDEIVTPGTWIFTDNSTQLTLTSNGQNRLYRIDKLDEDELNVTDVGSTNNRMIQFVPS